MFFLTNIWPCSDWLIPPDWNNEGNTDICVIFPVIIRPFTCFHPDFCEVYSYFCFYFHAFTYPTTTAGKLKKKVSTGLKWVNWILVTLNSLWSTFFMKPSNNRVQCSLQTWGIRNYDFLKGRKVHLLTSLYYCSYHNCIMKIKDGAFA